MQPYALPIPIRLIPRRLCQFIMTVLLLGCLTPVQSAAQSGEDQAPIRIAGETMGTYYSVIVESPGSLSEADLKQKVESALAEFNRQMSTWDTESEISKFNQIQSEDWFPVSRDFALNVEESLRIHKLSGGIFDPTLAPLIEAWGFGRNKEKRVPPADEIAAALKDVGLTGITVRLDPPALKKSNPRLTINLSAIAPGFAIDLIAGILEREGLKSWLVDVGGEARAGKRKPNGQFWKIGVESPLGNIHRIVELEDKAIATSGNYRSFFVMDGKRYSHILDPVTGYPVPNPPASVTVLHASNMTADALATTLMALGIEKGMQLAERENLDVLFLDVGADGKVIEVGRGSLAPKVWPRKILLNRHRHRGSRSHRGRGKHLNHRHLNHSLESGSRHGCSRSLYHSARQLGSSAFDPWNVGGSHRQEEATAGKLRWPCCDERRAWNQSLPGLFATSD